MSFTYDVTELNSNKLYQVRLNIGNTDEYGLVVLQDEEIQHFLNTSYEHVTDASVKAIDALISRASIMCDRETGQVQESASQLIGNLQNLRDDMLNSVARNVPKFMQITGMFEDDRQTVQADNEIYHDGIDLTSEYPGTKLINGPTYSVNDSVQ